MIENTCRARVDATLLTPVIKYLAQFSRLSPNHLSLAALSFGIGVFVSLLLGHAWLACGLLLLSGYCDILDGAYARVTGKATDQGAVLDILCDRAVEFLVILGLYYIEPAARAEMIIFMLGSVLLCVTSFLVVGIYTANQSEKGFYYSVGIMERAEAFVFFMLMILLPQYFHFFSNLQEKF